MRRARWITLAVLTILCLGQAHSGPAAGAEKASLRLEWRLTGYQLPYYWAQAKGYYAQEGIQLTIGEGTGSGPTVQILSGNNDTFGLADAMVMATGVGKGMQLKAIAAPIQMTPWAYVSYAATGIKTPRDLMGKSVAVVPAHETLHNLFLERHQIPPDKVLRRLDPVIVKLERRLKLAKAQCPNGAALVPLQMTDGPFEVFVHVLRRVVTVPLGDDGHAVEWRCIWEALGEKQVLVYPVTDAVDLAPWHRLGQKRQPFADSKYVNRRSELLQRLAVEVAILRPE